MMYVTVFAHLNGCPTYLWKDLNFKLPHNHPTLLQLLDDLEYDDPLALFLYAAVSVVMVTMISFRFYYQVVTVENAPSETIKSEEKVSIEQRSSQDKATYITRITN
jgi:hypothetical protein